MSNATSDYRIPRPDIRWRTPWSQIEDEEQQQGIQAELQRELSSAHSLWKTAPVVFGKHQGNDDVLVALADGRFAIVHLVWHGKVDQFPDKFPWTHICADLQAFQQELDSEADDWRESEEPG